MSAFVVESHLKIMLEEDYVALQQHFRKDLSGMEELMSGDKEVISGMSSEIVKDLIIPEIEKEVNSGKTFSNLRQIFQSMILASWYKQRLKESLLGKIYVDKDHIPSVLSGYGTAVISTSKGLLTDKEARKQGMGGELICQIW